MKKALVFSMLFIGAIMIGCANIEDDSKLERTITEDTWEISINASENGPYEYKLMENYPTEGGPEITKEPGNAQISEITYDNGINYAYQPEAGFTGTDEVEITNNISAGGSEIVAKTILKLTIVVRE